MTIQTICDTIVLIAAVCVAITNILNFFGKPIKFFNKRKKKEFQDNLNEALPEILEKHNKEIKNDLKKIMEINLAQNEQIRVLTDGSKDLLREKIMTIYERNKSKQSMFEYERRQLNQFYKDYKKEGGNTYIDSYYTIMQEWDTLPDE